MNERKREGLKYLVVNELSVIETVSQGHALKSHAGALIASKTLFVRWLLEKAGVNEKADSQHD